MSGNEERQQLLSKLNGIVNEATGYIKKVNKINEEIDEANGISSLFKEIEPKIRKLGDLMIALGTALKGAIKIDGSPIGDKIISDGESMPNDMISAANESIEKYRNYVNKKIQEANNLLSKINECQKRYRNAINSYPLYYSYGSPIFPNIPEIKTFNH